MEIALYKNNNNNNYYYYYIITKREPITEAVTDLHGGDDVGDSERVVEGHLGRTRVSERVEGLRQLDNGEDHQADDGHHEDEHQLDGLPRLVLVGPQHFLV